MRSQKWFAALAVLGFAAVSTFTSSARAEEEFDVAVSGATVVITAKGGWHVNKDYPWKLTIGDVKVDKSKFTFTESTATLANAPKGAAKIRGALCSGNKCKNFEKSVKVQ
jgi:hypothetical protein